jgi:hypothetical protein
VKELFHGVQTVKPTLSVTFAPGNDQLTLSAGALFSNLPSRSYSIVNTPAADGSTSNKLQVSGDGVFAPYLLGLLNYEIPHMSKPNLGFALSSGPVLRVGSSSDTSSFGYFVGGSFHLYHRFYISPGIHIGEYADYPPGFSSAGQTVPSGITTLTPTKKWLVRFSFGVTYQAKDFSTVGIKPATTEKPSDTTKPATPKS